MDSLAEERQEVLGNQRPPGAQEVLSLGTVLERVLVLCVCRGMGTGTESCWGSSTEPGSGESPGPGTGLVPCRAPQLHPSGPSCLGEWGEEGNLCQRAIIPHLHRHLFLILPGSAFLLPSARTLSCSLPGQILPPASLSRQRKAQPMACPAPGAVRALGTLLAPWQRAGLWGDEAPAHPAAAAACAQSSPCPSPPHARCSHVPAIRRLPSAHTPDRCRCQGPACSRCLGWHHCLGNSSATRTAQAGCAHGSERAALGSEESEITRQRREREMLQEAPRHPGWSGFITKCSPI